MPESRSIPVANLLLDSENPRLGAGPSSQVEAAQAMLTAERQKTLKLAEDIKDNGLNPAERLIVLRTDDPLRFIVLEGNRRLTALRVLAEPSIAEPTLKKPSARKLNEWSAAYLKKPIHEIDCAIFDQRVDAGPWLRKRHTGEAGGVGVVGWGSIEQRRFEERLTGIKRLDTQALDLVASKGDLDDGTREQLHDFPITNLERLLEDEAVRTRLGLALDTNRQLTTNLPDEEIVKPLARMVRDIANKTIQVDQIYDAAKRTAYLNSFKKGDLPDFTKAGSVAGVLVAGALPKSGAAGKDTAAKGKGRAGPAKPRKSVVHPQCRLYIPRPRIDRVFNELRALRVDDFPNTVGVLLRVFLEFTVDHYFKHYKLSPLPKGKDTLAARLSSVAKDAVTRGLMTSQEVKGIENASREKKVIGANIYTFHGFVHNPDFAPQSVDLRTYWDNLQVFFEKVWAK